jgi:putative Flp pilus-assembly TadE/G-like protein
MKTKIFQFNAILRTTRALLDDTRGIILPYVTVMLVVIVGVSVLALDGARYVNLQTQLQQGADALALAGAVELDRLPDAACRATTAINNYIQNVYGPTVGQNVTASSIRFLSSLPNSDRSAITSSNLVPNTSPDPDCTHGVTAGYVEVTVGLVSMDTILPASFISNLSGSNTVTTGAQAIAGNNRVICKTPPMYICNPYEQAGNTYTQATQNLLAAIADPAILRRQIQMKGDGSYGSGNFGYLNISANGANALMNAIGNVNSGQCFVQNSVDTQPGVISAANNAFNVRFDIYASNFSNSKNDPNYAPATSVRKGYVTTGGNACSGAPATVSTQAMGLPRDANIISTPSTTLGNGNWDCSTYWNTEHPVGTSGANVPPAGCANPATTSRYNVYQYEMSYLSDRSPGDPSAHPPIVGEIGAPVCNTQSLPANTIDRRMLYAAIVNCQCLAAGNCYPGAPTLNGNTTDVPVAAYGKFFLTEPVGGSGTSTTIYSELTSLAKPDDGSNTVFNSVQLYR